MTTALTKDWKEIASKTISTTGFTGEFLLYAKVKSQDITNNKSVVAYTWELDIDYGWVKSYDARDYVSGAGWNSTTYREYTSSGVLRSGEETITHNADGTKSDYGIGRTIMGGMGIDTGDVRGDYTLPTIPRASVPTASPNPLTIGSSGATLTIDTHRKSSSFTHTIKVQCGNWSWTSSARSVGASTTCTIPYSVIGQFGSSDKTKTATVYCDTYNGTTHIGDQKSCTVTLQIDTTYDYVTIDNIAISDANARTSAITQDDSIMISNISTLQAVVECGTHGSYTTLYHAVVTCGNVSQTFPLSGTSDSFTFTFDKVNASSLKINLMSNRSTGTTQNASWTLIAYQPVTATATVGRPSATGSVGVGQLTGMAYGGNFGATQNSLTIEVDFKKHDDPDYDSQGTEIATLALEQSGYNSYSDAFTFNYTLDYQYQYDIKFTVSDLFSTVTYVAQMMQGLPIISWDENEVDVFGDLHIHDRIDPYKYQNVLEGFDAVLEHDGLKNLTPMTTATKTENGITFTKYATYYNINGTATANAFCNCSTSNYMEAGKRYILSGMHDQWVEGIQVVVRYQNSTEYVVSTTVEDVEFTAPAPCYAYIVVLAGTTVNNKKWYPMIRDARIKSEEYVRYAPSNLQLNDAINTLSAMLTIREYHYEGNLANNGGSYNRTFTLSGKGVVIFSMFLWSSTADDTGQLWADVQQMNSAGSGVVRYLGYSGNRLSSSSTFQNGANAMGVVYMDGSGTNNKIRIRCSSTKNGVAPWKCHIVSFGCTVS